MTVYFYTTTDAYGAFSNFSRHGIAIDGIWWPTVEHYFQAQKFDNSAYQAQIRAAATPKQAAALGRSRQVPLRSDWETVKDTIMLQAVRQKFQTHAEIRALLLSTGEEPIVENAPGDYYWGCGKEGTGLNKLGQILQQVRTEIWMQQPSP